MPEEAETLRAWLASIDPELIFLDGLDDAILGIVERVGERPVVLYDRERAIELLAAQGVSRQEAEEHLDFNVAGGWVGELTPAFATLWTSARELYAG